jgi:RNA polymerase primary sigma factor
MRRISSRLEEELGREPTDGELAAEMQVPAHKAARLRSAGLRTVSLDTRITDDQDDTFAAHISDENMPTPSQELEACGDSEVLRVAAASLTPREQLVLNRRYGLDDGVERTLEEVSEMVGLTRERVRQIQNEAIVKLRRGFASFEAAGVTEAACA